MDMHFLESHQSTMEDSPSSEDALFEAREKGLTKDPSLWRCTEYQMKIAALCVISSLKEEGIRYNLSIADKSSGKFDDVVIKVAQGRDLKRWCVQVRHMEVNSKISFYNLFFQQKGEFYLRKYFQSFLEIREKVGYKQGAVERYIIYTPAALDFDDDSTESGHRVMTSGRISLRFKKVMEDQDLLNINKYSVFQLESDDFIRCNLRKTSRVTDDDIESFLKHFRFAVEQPTNDQINDILLEKAREADTGFDPEDLIPNIFKGLNQWCIEQWVQCKYFTECDVAEVMLHALTHTYIKSVSLDNVTLSHCCYIWDFLKSKQDVLWVSTSNLKLCSSKLVQIISASFAGSSLVSYFEDLKKVRNIVIPFLPLNANSVIIVVLEAINKLENDNPLLSSLISKFISMRQDPKGADNKVKKKLKRKHKLSKLVLVSTDIVTKDIKEMLETHKNIYYVQDDLHSFTSFPSETQFFVMYKTVNFQGFSVTLRELFIQNCAPSFMAEYITRLLEEENTSVGRKVTSLCETIGTYCHRTLYHPQILGKECLRDLIEELIVLQISEKMMKNEIEKKTITVIAAEPGMGKTTELNHVVEEVKKKHKDWWIIKVSLRHFASKFLNINVDVSITDFSKRLSEIFLEGETSLSKALYQHSLEETGKFILLLDGYDEIASREEREIVLLVLRKLKELSRGQVIITTRLHFKEELEEATSTFAYRLEPLDENEQKKLLAEIWITNLVVSSDKVNPERVYAYARKVVENLSKKFDERIGRLIGIPLQITLLAELFEESCVSFCNEEAKMDLHFTNLLSLYTEFENKKYKKFVRSELIEGEPIKEILVDIVCKEHRSECTQTAIHELFGDNSFPCDCCQESAVNKPSLLDEQHILMIGILHNSEEASKSFIHRTFAEYFFALHIVQLITKKTPCKKFTKLLIGILYGRGYEVIREFVDNALAQSKIHISALMNDVNALREELEHGADINERDALGRNACHLAVTNECVEAFEFLISRGCDLQAKENIANFTPSELALELHSWTMCSLLLSKEFRVKLSTVDEGLVEYLCKEGKTEKLRDLMRENPIYSVLLIPSFSSFVAIAVDNGHVETVRLLLNYAKHQHFLNNIYFYDDWKEIISPNQIACWQLTLEITMNEKEFLSFGRVLLKANVMHIKALFFEKIESLNKREVSLTEVILIAIFSQYEDLMAKAFDKISQVTKDLPSYILQPFESHKTLVHFAAAYNLGRAVELIMQEKGVDIFADLFPENIQDESLIHLAAKKGNTDLLRFLIKFIRQNKRNVMFFLSQKDSYGKTPLHTAVSCNEIGTLELLILEARKEQTSSFDSSCFTAAECDDKGTSFDLLFERIMARGNNLLACIMWRDLSERNCLDYLKEKHIDESCSCCEKIDDICPLQWIKREMEVEIERMFPVIQTTPKTHDFMNYLFVIPKRRQYIPQNVTESVSLQTIPDSQ